MTKINSELPLQMMDKYNRKLNDFDFVLFHLYITNEHYKQYFLKMRKRHPKRLMILDNSAYEFYVKGLDFADYENQFLQTIQELVPDYYILPDKLMDKNATIARSLKFQSKYKEFIPNKSKPMCVLQGDSVQEFIDCITIYKEANIDSVCVPFHNSFLKALGKDNPDPYNINKFLEFYDNCYNNLNGNPIIEDVLYAVGRVRLMKGLLNQLKSFKHIHMLGSHCPVEKQYYNDKRFTMDTGYPVKLGIEDIEFGKEQGKPNIIIDDFLDGKIPKHIKKRIIQNVKIFKEM